ncbi:MAG: hypothetical protein ABI647_12375 [Gemmatimonadota bacterium]
MADKLPFEQPLRQAMEASLRYYAALGQVTQEYFKALFGIANTFPIRLGGGGTNSASTPRPANNASVPASAATLVLEAPAGSEAQGVFMVENRLPRTVSTAVVTSAFADPSGRAVEYPLRVVPSVITLEPGGRTLVQIFATVTDTLEPNVPYRGEVNVPGLAERGIPVLLRRQAQAPASHDPSERRPAPESAPKKRVTGRKRRSSSRRTGSES